MMFGAGQSKERIKRRGQSLTTELVPVSHENTFCDYIYIFYHLKNRNYKSMFNLHFKQKHSYFNNKK